jgi:Fibronectin type III domain
MKLLFGRCLLTGLFGFALILVWLPMTGFAADFLLEWNPNSDSDLVQGYNVYYQEDSSVADNPAGATKVDIPLDAQGFDQANPSYTLAGLKDDALYYFAVSAYNAAGESDLSTEVSLSKGASGSGGSPGTGGPNGSGSSGGCFIGALR